MPDVFVSNNGSKKPDKNSPKTDSSPKDSPSPAKSRQPEDYAELLRTAPRTTNPFSAFVVRPKNLNFETQDPEEKILLLLRKHPITNVPWILTSILGLFAPAILYIVPLIGFLPARFQFITIVFWYLLVIGYIVQQFLDWYFNVYIITDERIIDFDFYSLIYKRVSETKIDRIEDVTYQMAGVTRSIFNFGTVYIQTAGEAREFDFEDTPQPQQVAKLLNELQLQEEQEVLEGRVR